MSDVGLGLTAVDETNPLSPHAQHTIYYIVLYSTLLYSALLCSALLYSTLLYSTLLYSTLLYSTLLYHQNDAGFLSSTVWLGKAPTDAALQSCGPQLLRLVFNHCQNPARPSTLNCAHSLNSEPRLLQSGFICSPSFSKRAQQTSQPEIVRLWTGLSPSTVVTSARTDDI